MKYLLDTNICVHFFRGKYNLETKFNEVGIFNFTISEITLAELIYGAEHSSNVQKNLQLIESFASHITIVPIIDCIYLYGKEKSRLRKIGKMISDFDLLIGTTAISSNLIMVTENISEFKRIEGIIIENWITR
ncbi:type II toxin-antitoxin system VapC family toxin [Flavobacterium subsaxonicum]|uniref:DNA-binding protein n=1 Tax=Flavobacterium subsaxonicum WB 4.1-42 = DSM 21790 TaxID=1121898 RepID=A0A0A2ML86_9FLAO|nr:type II toxin-antitoxin system VapC family toxin [Flavobacterium subsaxonicum]KGO93422.1 DNA-binding protein [Flavobacterium subsaxonicum WB 4.1-42 = DSM 21790]